MEWIKRNWMWILLVIIGIRTLKKHKQAAQNDPLDPFSYAPVSQETIIGEFMQSNSAIKQERLVQLYKIAEEIHNSLKGIGSRGRQFVQAMIQIKNDNEFEFVNMAVTNFTKQKLGIIQRVNSERLMSDKVKNIVNQDYENKNMKVRLEM